MKSNQPDSATNAVGSGSTTPKEREEQHSAAQGREDDDLVQLLIDLDSHWREGKSLADRLTRLLEREDERVASQLTGRPA